VYILIGPRIAVAQQPGPDIRLIDISLAEHPFFFRRLAETMPAHGPVFFFLGIGGVWIPVVIILLESQRIFIIPAGEDIILCVKLVEIILPCLRAVNFAGPPNRLCPIEFFVDFDCGLVMILVIVMMRVFLVRNIYYVIYILDIPEFPVIGTDQIVIFADHRQLLFLVKKFPVKGFSLDGLCFGQKLFTGIGFLEFVQRLHCRLSAVGVLVAFTGIFFVDCHFWDYRFGVYEARGLRFFDRYIIHAEFSPADIVLFLGRDRILWAGPGALVLGLLLAVVDASLIFLWIFEWGGKFWVGIRRSTFKAPAWRFTFSMTLLMFCGMFM
jgi:hypothetical protein